MIFNRAGLWSLIAFGMTAVPLPVLGQSLIVPDDTLGAEGSVVTEGVEVRGALADRIDGGALRDANLFHSFSEFNVSEGQRVYFGNPADVANIFSRVTGSDPSDILGTLGVDGAANLFFLNPNGIVFGENASLDIEGSFVGSAGTGFNFADGSEFSAVTPGDSSLLTVSVPLGLQRGDAPTGNVMNEADLSTIPGESLTLFGDTVVHRGRLAAAGGTVNLLGNRVALMDGAQVDVSSETGGGQVFIGGDLQGQGPLPTAQTVYVEPDVEINASALSTGDGGQVVVWAEDATYFAGAIAARGGDLTGNGGFVEVSGRQILDYRGQTDATAPNGAVGTLLLDPTNILVVADPGETLDLGQVDEFGIPDIGGDGATFLGVGAINGAQANVVLQALQDIIFFVPVDIVSEGVGLRAQASGSIGIFAQVGTNGGDISLIAGDETSGNITDNAQILIQGNLLSDGGDLLLQSGQDIFINRVSVATSELTGAGAGNLTIDAGNLVAVTNGGQVIVSTLGDGDAGNLSIQADTIELIGVNPINGNPSGLFANVEAGATGTGGDITITDTSRLSIRDGAQLLALTFATGDSGTIDLNADLVEVIGSDANGGASLIVAQVNTGAIGNAQDLTINAQQLLVQDGGQISVSTFSEGNAGDLSIQADVIELSGVNPVISGTPSGLFANVSGNAAGTGGDITITDANRLSIRDGAEIAASTFATGDGGTLTIDADLIEVIGSDLEENPSNISAQVNEAATGNAQDATINAQQVFVQDGGQISVSTFGEGDAGDLSIRADVIELSGVSPVNGEDPSLLLANVSGGATGTAGGITLDTQQLFVQDGGQISVSTFGEGDAGDLSIRADVIELSGVNPVISDTPSGLFANVSGDAAGTGGDITITDANRLSIRDGAEIAASTFATGDSGTLTIDTVSIEVIGSDAEGNPSNISAQVNAGATGNVQDVTINAQQLLLQDGGQVSVSTFGEGNAGTLNIQVDFIELIGDDPIDGDPSGLFANVSGDATGTGGDIAITDVSRLSVLDGATLSASTLATGDGGTLTIEAESVEVIGDDAEGNASIIAAQVNSEATGNAQDLSIDAKQLLVQDGGQINVSTFGEGNAGNLTLNVDTIELIGDSSNDGDPSGLFANVEPNATGTGGSITITGAEQLSISSGAELSASTFGIGDSGTLTINAQEIEVFGTDLEGNSSSIDAQVAPGGTGNAQSLNITAQQLSARDGGQILVSTFGEGNAGDLIIDADEIALTGFTPINGNPSGLFANVEPDATGLGGDISITGAQTLSLTDGAELSASTFGVGDSGTLTVDAQQIEVIGSDAEGDSSAIVAQVTPTGTGNARSLTVMTQVLSVRDGGQVRVSTLGEGNAGNLIINANDIELIGANTIDGTSSGLFATVEPGATGTGGDISVIGAEQLSILAGAELSASTLGAGDGGTLSVNANLIQVIGRDTDGNPSNIAAQVGIEATGNARDLTIDAQQLSVQDGAFISGQTLGEGNAGSLFINASDIQISGENSLITALTATDSQAGTIRIRPTDGDSDLSVAFQDRASISAATSGNQPGGGVILSSPESIILSGDGSISAVSTSDAEAGNLTIATNELLLTNGIEVTVSSLGSGDSGTLTVRAQNALLNNQAQLIAETNAGTGGDIDLQIADALQLDNSRISAATQNGQGGRVEVNTSNLILSDRATISAESSGEGIAGDLVLNVRNHLDITDSDITTTAPQSSGGDVLINTASNTQNTLITLEGDSDITTNSLGDGGNITIGGSVIIATDDSDIISSSGAATGGNITLTRFFSEPTPPGNALDFDGNDQVDVNASGAIASGTITVPDTSFIQNSLSDLPEGTINTESLIAGSCVTRNEDGSSTFTITGAEGLRDRPGNETTGYPTGEVQLVPESQSWQPGDPIVEPQGVYQLPNGELVLSHSCR